MSLPLRTFDRQDDFTIVARSGLPHWAQAGTICFITFRTWDSLPRPVLHQWLKLRNAWLREHGIDALAGDWRIRIADLPPVERDELRAIVSERWENALDECHGQCVLRQPALAEIVANSLLHFDEQRYVLTDFVVMPNHVHLLASFPTEEALLEQCDSWKHFTAVQINRRLGRQGRFWEEDQFDHLVRSPEWFDHYRRYIGDNSDRARLQPGEYVHFSKALGDRAT
jgi:type I restriction enzyme R subunit